MSATPDQIAAAKLASRRGVDLPGPGKRPPIPCRGGRHQRWAGDAYFDERMQRWVRRYPCCGEVIFIEGWKPKGFLRRLAERFDR